MPANLLIHNILFFFGALLNIAVVIFVLFSLRKNINAPAITFSLMSLAVAGFQISHLIGTNMPTASSSRSVLMWNLSDIFIVMFMAHWFLAITGKVRKRIVILTIIYISGLSLFGYLVSHPTTFLVDSMPKLYLPFYYEPGKYYFLMPVWFVIVGLYNLLELSISYKQEKDPVQKNRLDYMLFSVLYGFCIGSTAFLLVFDVTFFDPVWSSLFGLYTLPLAYAMIQYELLDIKIIAKRAFIYAVVMTGVGILIGGLNFAGNYIGSIAPNLPKWITPLVLSALVSGSGIYIWRKARREDIAKFEFINLVSHRFRGPLTEIRWAIDMIKESKSPVSEEISKSLNAIKESESKMSELTNMLITLNLAETKQFTYHFAIFDMLDVAKSLVSEYKERYLKKNITIDIISSFPSANAYGDKEKIKFVTEILISNALYYTNNGGSVTIKFEKHGNSMQMAIKDTGIGIAETDQDLIFGKFYRAQNAQRSSVDGTGVGLYLARLITERNGGHLVCFSGGIGKGSTFTLSLPLRP